MQSLNPPLVAFIIERHKFCMQDTTYKLLTYDFNPPTDKNRPFLIHPSTGVITLTSALDYESGISAYSFQVAALASLKLKICIISLLLCSLGDSNQCGGSKSFRYSLRCREYY